MDTLLTGNKNAIDLKLFIAFLQYNQLFYVGSVI